MRRVAGRLLLATTLATALSTAAAQAQPAPRTQSCDLVQQADFRQIVNARGEQVIYFRDPVRFRCTGGVIVQSDSAVFNRAAGLLELVGSVVYRDSTQQMTSAWANYLGAQAQVLARGDVVLTDLADGSVVRGQTLNYLRATPERPVSRVLIEGGRPHATLRERQATADTAAPLEVWANRMEIIGETTFHGRGAVELERGTMTGAADSARFDQLEEHVVLTGRAWIRDERYRLQGRRIDARLEGEALREVVADRDARLDSEELTVESSRLRIGFVDGALDRMEAWMPGEDADGPRAHALAEDFRLRADSIDARAEQGRLREVRAVHRAYGERRLDEAVPGPAVLASDWIQGDTIIGYFADVPAPDDTLRDVAIVADEATAEPVARDTVETVLERVVVIGGGAPALSLYRRAADDERVAGRYSINFMRAMRIVLFLAGGEVDRVEAEGELEGMYLDPIPQQPPDGTRVGRRTP